MEVITEFLAFILTVILIIVLLWKFRMPLLILGFIGLVVKFDWGLGIFLAFMIGLIISFVIFILKDKFNISIDFFNKETDTNSEISPKELRRYQHERLHELKRKASYGTEDKYNYEERQRLKRELFR